MPTKQRSDSVACTEINEKRWNEERSSHERRSKSHLRMQDLNDVDSSIRILFGAHGRVAAKIA